MQLSSQSLTRKKREKSRWHHELLARFHALGTCVFIAPVSILGELWVWVIGGTCLGRWGSVYHQKIKHTGVELGGRKMFFFLKWIGNISPFFHVKPIIPISRFTCRNKNIRSLGGSWDPLNSKYHANMCMFSHLSVYILEIFFEDSPQVTSLALHLILGNISTIQYP